MSATVSGSRGDRPAALIGIVWAFMRFVPRYAFGTSPGVVGYNVDSGMEVQFDSLYVITDTADLLTLLLAVSLGALVVLALAGGALGWVLAGRMLRPLAAINAAASKAATGALDHRVALAGPRDEIRDLSDTFDTMLAALERSFEVHWRFAANASHELRTPLTTTQTMIDVTMADPEADAESLRALAGRVREVNSANIATVGALLDLSDIDRSRLTRTPFDVAAVVAEGAAQAAEADRNGVSLNVETPDRESGPVEVVGDPVLVRQAVGNLIQNAIRHNEPGGTAAVRVTRLADRAVVTVTNTGPPVDPGIVESLVEPFVRGSGRTTGRGYGLGLALAASIADAHDGSLRLAANPSGGLIAELTLPTSP